MKTKIDQLRQLMKKSGLDAVALNPSPNMTYLTGLHYHLMERPIVLIIPLQGQPVAILPEFEIGKLKTVDQEFTSFSYNDNPDTWNAVFRKACDFSHLNQMKTGVDPNHFRYLEYKFLQDNAPQAQFIPAGNEISGLRICKDSQELALMKKAVQIAQAAFEATLPFIRPGVTEIEIAQELTYHLLHNGSDGGSEFQPIIASGPNSANPHHTPGIRQVCTGDAIVIDWGAYYQDYYSDLTRTVVIGNPSPDFEKVYQTVAKANAAGIAAGRPGIQAGAVDLAARQEIETAGYGVYFTHRTGHGLGMEVHEPVYIYAENTTPLEPGMTYTIEPGIYLPGLFGVRIEDNVVVTENGCLCLSDLSREIRVL